MKTRVPALFTTGLLALSLAACGAEEAPEPAAESSPAAGGENGGGGLSGLLASLRENTADATNYTLDVRMASEDPDLGEFSVDFTFEVMDDPEAAKTTMVMPEIGEMLLELAALGGTGGDLTAEELGTTVIIAPAGGEALVSNHNGLQEADTPWVRGGTAGAEGMKPEEMFDLSEFPDLVGAFSGVEGIEETGAEEVGGVPTTVVSGTLTQEQVEAMDPASRAVVEDFTGGSVSGALEVGIWIAEDGFPMRLELADEETDLGMEFSEIGTTSFEIPSEDEISDM